MNELFASPDQDWRPVSPALARLRRLMLVGGTVLLAAALLITSWLLPIPLWVLILAGLMLLVLLAGGWFLLGRNAAAWGYAEREDDLYVKHGAMFRTLVVVPYGRMQYVDVAAGPLQQAFRVASVHLHTASPGTSARIPGLPAAEAARLRDRLTDLGESRAAGL